MEILNNKSILTIEQTYSPKKKIKATDRKVKQLQLENKLDTLIQAKKETNTNWEKMDSYGNAIGLIIDYLPDFVEEATDFIEEKQNTVEHPFIKNVLDKAETLVDGLDKAPPLLEAAQVIVLGLLSSRVNQQIAIYQKEIENLGQSNQKKVDQLKLKINKLEQCVTKTVKKTKPENLKLVFENAIKNLIPLLPNAEKVLEGMDIFGESLFKTIELTAITITIKQKYEAIQLLNQIKAAVEKEKKELEKSNGNKEKIEKLQIKIEKLQKNIYNEKVKITSEGINLFSEIVNTLKPFLPENSALIADSLKLISKGVGFGLPGKKVVQRVMNIRDLKKKVSAFDPYCAKLEGEIANFKNSLGDKAVLDENNIRKKNFETEQDQLDFFQLQAKENLLHAIRNRQTTFREAWIPMEMIRATEEILGALTSGQKITKKFMAFLSIGKVTITAIGTAGMGLTVAGVILKICLFFLNDIASIQRWKLNRVLAKDKKSLIRATKKYENLSNKIYNMNKDEKLAYCQTEIAKLERLGMEFFQDLKLSGNVYADFNNKTQLINKIKKQLINFHKKKEKSESDKGEIKKLEREYFKNTQAIIDLKDKIRLINDLKLKSKNISKLKNIFNNFKEKFNKKDEISDIKNFLKAYKTNLSNQKINLDKREKRLENEYQERRKLNLLGLSKELYDGYKHDLSVILKHPTVKKEFVNYMTEQDKEVAEKIFLEDDTINMDLLTDYFIPPLQDI